MLQMAPSFEHQCRAMLTILGMTRSLSTHVIFVDSSAMRIVISKACQQVWMQFVSCFSSNTWWIFNYNCPPDSYKWCKFSVITSTMGGHDNFIQVGRGWKGTFAMWSAQMVIVTVSAKKKIVLTCEFLCSPNCLSSISLTRRWEILSTKYPKISRVAAKVLTFSQPLA